MHDFVFVESPTNTDSGGKGKRLERSFLKILRMNNMEYEENGLIGIAGTLWDFAPVGLGWKNLPDGAKVNIKITGNRTLWSSVPFWRTVFNREYESESEANAIVKKSLRKIGFTKIYWLSPKTDSIAEAVIKCGEEADLEAAIELVKEKNWSIARLPSYRAELEMDGQNLKYIRLFKGGERWGQVSYRNNKGAGVTTAVARTTSGKAKRPFKALSPQEKIEKLLQKP